VERGKDGWEIQGVLSSEGRKLFGKTELRRFCRARSILLKMVGKGGRRTKGRGGVGGVSHC